MSQAKQELIIDDAIDAQTGLVATQTAEINQQISTAHHYPRPKIRQILNKVTEMATINQDVAGSMFYSLPRAKKNIEGGSIRLAEIFATQYGNMRAGARIVSIGKDLITAQGFAHDLESNFAYSIEVQRSIRKSSGERYNTDLIRLQCLVAQAIAFRESVFKVVPKVYVDEMWKHCRRVAIGSAESIVDRREKVATSFSKMGISKERIALALGLSDFDKIQNDHIGTLRGLYTAIKEEDTSLDEAFPPIAQSTGAQVASGVPPKQVTGVQGSELMGGGPPPVKPKRTRKPPQATPEDPVAPPKATEPSLPPEPPQTAEVAPEDGQGTHEAAPAGPSGPESVLVPDKEVASAPIQMQPPVDLFHQQTGNGNAPQGMPEPEIDAEVSDPAAEARRSEWEDYIIDMNTIKPMKLGGDIRNRVDVDTSMGPSDRKYLNDLMDRQVEALRAKRQ